MKPPKETAPATAYSYIRFSSHEQGKGDSVRRQTEMREDWLARHPHARLDTSLKLADEGVSAFVGDHRSNPDRHALAAFLELIRQNRIANGSYLIIENLDRLTREDAVPALHLFTGILSSGVRIVQLDPECVYTAKSEYMEIMMAIMELSRGNSESKNKSRRMAGVWSEKRKRAVADGAVISRSCPAWIRVEGKGASARYALIPAAAETVRRIFRMAIEGQGGRSILNTLLAEKVPPISRKPWTKSYLQVLLKRPAVYGEFTPRSGRGSSQKRKPTGPPIPNYYPAVIKPEEFWAAQAAMKGRRVRGGRPSKGRVNVFAAMLFDARTGGRLHLKAYAQGNGCMAPSLTPYQGTTAGGDCISFPLDVFEASVFEKLREINPKELLPASNAAADALLALAGRKADVEGQLVKIKASIRAGAELDTLLDLVRELEDERKRLEDQLVKARQAAACPAAEAWAEAGTLLDALESAPDQDAARTRLRAVLRRNIAEVWCLFMPGRQARLAAVQLWFTDSAQQRSFIIYHKPKANHHASSRAVRKVLSFASLAGDLDLRKREDAAQLEKDMASVDLSTLTE